MPSTDQYPTWAEEREACWRVVRAYDHVIAVLEALEAARERAKRLLATSLRSVVPDLTPVGDLETLALQADDVIAGLVRERDLARSAAQGHAKAANEYARQVAALRGEGGA